MLSTVVIWKHAPEVSAADRINATRSDRITRRCHRSCGRQLRITSLELRAGCKISSLAGGRERGRPAGRGAVGRDKCSSGEHPVGLFADRTRLELILQRTLNCSAAVHQPKGYRKQQESDGTAPVADRFQQEDRVREGDRGSDGERERGEADEYPAERSHARIICAARLSTRDAKLGTGDGPAPTSAGRRTRLSCPPGADTRGWFSPDPAPVCLPPCSATARSTRRRTS